MSLPSMPLVLIEESSLWYVKLLDTGGQKPPHYCALPLTSTIPYKIDPMYKLSHDNCFYPPGERSMPLLTMVIQINSIVGDTLLIYLSRLKRSMGNDDTLKNFVEKTNYHRKTQWISLKYKEIYSTTCKEQQKSYFKVQVIISHNYLNYLSYNEVLQVKSAHREVASFSSWFQCAKSAMKHKFS